MSFTILSIVELTVLLLEPYSLFIMAQSARAADTPTSKVRFPPKQKQKQTLNVIFKGYWYSYIIYLSLNITLDLKPAEGNIVEEPNFENKLWNYLVICIPKTNTTRNLN